jgi:F0F1-type ATP synthase membrane subunit b/b'
MTRAVRKSVRSLACFGSLFLFAAAPAFAEEAKQSPADAPVGQVFRWINFAIVMALLIYGFRKALPYFHTHAEEISQKIAEGARAREAAEKRRSEAQAKLASIGTDVAEMRLEAKRAAALEAERVRGLARTEADTIERAAQAEIAATERAARLELKTLAARMAIERAEVLLREELKPKVQTERFLELVVALSVLVVRQGSETEGSVN